MFFLAIEDPHCVIVLCEEELVAIDLWSKEWPIWRLPYLHSVHDTCITAAAHVTDIAEDVWEKIIAYGKLQTVGKGLNSKRDWPIQGGNNKFEVPEWRDVLITG